MTLFKLFLDKDLVLFLLYITRESTILLTLSVVLISVYKPNERKFALAVIGVTLIGVFVSSLAGRLGQTNIHAMSDLLYVGLKIPFNFLKNILGMQLWTNTFAAQLGGACKPVVTINLPAWLLIGSIRSIGVCPLDITYPLSTITSLLTTFGIAPTILIYSLRMNFRRILENSPFWLIVALTYGMISFFVGTSVGASVDRLIGYGWPSFWIATPVISLQYCLNNQKPSHKLLLFHVLACWIPWLVFSLYVKSPQSIILVLSIALMMHYLTFRAMRQSKDRT